MIYIYTINTFVTPAGLYQHRWNKHMTMYDSATAIQCECGEPRVREKYDRGVEDK